MPNRSIVTNPSTFTDDFVPSDLTGRQQEDEKLRALLAPLARRKPTKHVWIHGPPGTGKTCIAKRILNEMEERHGIKGIYLNCWESETFHSVLDRIVRDSRLLGTERLSTIYKLEVFEKYLQSKPFLLVLDEIDKPSPKERNSIIYGLCGVPNIVLVCICNSRYFYYVLDSRVQSRLNAVLLEFRAYTSDAMFEILRRRAEFGLREGSFKDEVLRRIAQISGGDARVAIQTLKNAASYAEVFASDHIQQGHIRTGHSIARNVKRKYVLQKLSEHHHLIYGIIQDRGEIRSGELWDEYQHRCKQARMQSAASRTFSLYLRRLEELELIISMRAVGIRGNVRIFRIKNG